MNMYFCSTSYCSPHAFGFGKVKWSIYRSIRESLENTEGREKKRQSATIEFWLSYLYPWSHGIVSYSFSKYYFSKIKIVVSMSLWPNSRKQSLCIAFGQLVEVVQLRLFKSLYSIQVWMAYNSLEVKMDNLEKRRSSSESPLRAVVCSVQRKGKEPGKTHYLICSILWKKLFY